jgi:RNA polymerase sigma-70 factor (ECF subfamily)
VLAPLPVPADNGGVVAAVPSVDVEVWFRTWGPMVHRRCSALLKNEAEADDATQEVFVRLVRRQQAGGVVDDKPVSYLWKVATHVCLNRLRTRRRRPEDGGDADVLELIAAVDDGVGTSPLRRALDRVFANEPPSTRTMAVLHYVDGLTLDETAAEMGMSVSGVRKRLRVLKARIATLPEREEL